MTEGCVYPPTQPSPYLKKSQQQASAAEEDKRTGERERERERERKERESQVEAHQSYTEELRWKESLMEPRL